MTPPESEGAVTPGHGDHWLAALAQDDARLVDLLAPPLDAPEGLKLHRAPLTASLDSVQITYDRRLVTAYPEPRATALIELRPRDLRVWETRVEGWFTAEHAGAGALTMFLTDLAENPHRYASAAPEGVFLEVAGLAYLVQPAPPSGKPPRMEPAAILEARFLPDDYWFDAEVEKVHQAGEGEVLDLRFQNDLMFPVAVRTRTGLEPGDRAQGYLWLTGRWPHAAPTG